MGRIRARTPGKVLLTNQGWSEAAADGGADLGTYVHRHPRCAEECVIHELAAAGSVSVQGAVSAPPAGAGHGCGDAPAYGDADATKHWNRYVGRGGPLCRDAEFWGGGTDQGADSRPTRRQVA